MKWIILLCGIASNATASVLIKLAVNPPYKLPTFNAPWEAFYNWPLLAGVTLYVLAFVLYATTLKFFPLNFAHPTLTSGAIGVVAILSVLLIGEQFRLSSVIGLSFIMLGVVLLTIGLR
jgi:small multidrug resistance pump